MVALPIDKLVSPEGRMARRIAEMLVLLVIHHDQIMTGCADPYAWSQARQAAATALDGFRTLGDRTARGELTIVVMPWPDPAVEAACRGASRFVPAWETR